MPKSENQKLKLLYLQKILLEQTDDDHYLRCSQLIDALDQVGISAERKSIYANLKELGQFGLDVEKGRENGSGYYVASRTFELAELKLLVDAVQSSKFITHKKSTELIRKIESLCSIHQAKLLQRQVYVTNRIKAMNESIYYNVDKIHAGIAENRKITFQYFAYTVGKERQFKRQGALYCSSPLALTWDDENYYMLGFDSEAGYVKHYRVDKMTKISVLEEPRQEPKEPLDMAQYSQKMFSMFGGREERVKLSLPNTLVGVVLDRFGKEITIQREGDDRFSVRITAAISSQFFGWLAALGSEVKVVSPPEVREEYLNHLRKILL